MIDTVQNPRLAKRTMASIALVALLVLAGFVTLFFASLNVFTSVALERAEGRAQLYRSTLISALERLEHLPFIVAQDPAVVRALAEKRVEGLNGRLEDFAQRSNAEAIYVMDANGWTIAASNYRNEVNFLGKNYGFRPYFKDAMAGKRGEFFAIGATTFKPGYFIGDPVRDANGDAIGVVALKVALSELTGAWAATGDDILVTNNDGIVVFATSDDWRYRSISPLSETQRAEIAAKQQFGKQDLTALAWQAGPNNQVQLDGTTYLFSNKMVEARGWTLWYIEPMANIYQRTWFVIVLGAIVLAGLAVAFQTFRSNQLRQALRASYDDRRKLLVEIEERKTAERRLERTQSELQRTSKLAALGQLAASVTHELGQPISAMRNYLAAEQISPKYKPGGLPDKLTALVARMENITKELKFFSSPAEPSAEEFHINDVINGAKGLTQHNLDAEVVEFETDMSIDLPPIRGNRQRLEQVFVNLFRNAISAMAEAQKRKISVKASSDRDWLTIIVEDSGHGLAGQTIEQLQEPFHTSKPSGQGMGLGLAISADIIREHGGSLSANDLEDGAEFVVRLPVERDQK